MFALQGICMVAICGLHGDLCVSLRIPVKWSGDSGEVVRCRSEATLAGSRMIQVDHIRQEMGPKDIH